MPFQLTDQNVIEYQERGCTVLRSLLTPALLRELRAGVVPAQTIAQRKTDIHGDQVLLELPSYADVLDLTPFHHYLEHPPLVEAVRKIVDPDATIDIEHVQILFEPRDRPMSTNWHRDMPERVQKWDPFRRCMAMANASFNCSIACALYADSCFSYVPASHGRPLTEAEQHAIDQWPDLDAVMRDGDPTVMAPEELELTCIESLRAMPGGVQFTLEAGDVLMYASYGLHFAHRASYRKRDPPAQSHRARLRGLGPPARGMRLIGPCANQSRDSVI